MLFRREYVQLPVSATVRIKFDSDPPLIEDWFTDSTDSAIAASTEPSVVRYMLDGISDSNRIMYEVHGEVSTFDFTYSDGAEAVAEYIKRCPQPEN